MSFGLLETKAKHLETKRSEISVMFDLPDHTTFLPGQVRVTDHWTRSRQRTGNRKPKTETRNPVLDGIRAKIMMEALTVRGLQETDTIKTADGKS